MNGLEKIYLDLLFSKAKYTGTRGHSTKLEKNPMHFDDIREHFFTQRVIDYWNALPLSAVNAQSINQMKTHLYKIIGGGGGRGVTQAISFLPLPTPR